MGLRSRSPLKKMGPKDHSHLRRKGSGRRQGARRARWRGLALYAPGGAPPRPPTSGPSEPLPPGLRAPGELLLGKPPGQRPRGGRPGPPGGSEVPRPGGVLRPPPRRKGSDQRQGARRARWRIPDLYGQEGTPPRPPTSGPSEPLPPGLRAPGKLLLGGPPGQRPRGPGELLLVKPPGQRPRGPGELLLVKPSGQRPRGGAPGPPGEAGKPGVPRPGGVLRRPHRRKAPDRPGPGARRARRGGPALSGQEGAPPRPPTSGPSEPLPLGLRAPGKFLPGEPPRQRPRVPGELILVKPSGQRPQGEAPAPPGGAGRREAPRPGGALRPPPHREAPDRRQGARRARR